MTFGSRSIVIGIALIALVLPSVPIDRIIGERVVGNVNEAAANTDKIATVMWEDLQQLDLRTGAAPASLKKLDGALVRVPGFIIPLEDNEQSVSEFLLVPYPLACIHVPAPPPNLIVHVKMEKGKKVPVNFYDPVWARGQFKIQTTQNMYTEASYFMTGLAVEPYRPEKKTP